MSNKENFFKSLPDWYKRYGRHGLPWRKTKNPYRILVSEVMLQQTQVSRVRQYYRTFLKKFPTERILAAAPLAEVFAVWSGLGYNRRAKYLRDAAFISVREWGKVPRDPEKLESLPGVGHYTAHAVSCFSGGVCRPFLETNIRRVLLHFFFPRSKNVPDEKLLAVLKKLIAGDIEQGTGDARDEALAHSTPRGRGMGEVSRSGRTRAWGSKTRSSAFSVRDWYLALMDYGSMELKSVSNPNRRSRAYMRQSKFEGSNRQVRGQVLKLLLASKKGMKAGDLRELIHPRSSQSLLLGSLKTLISEGMIHCSTPLTNATHCDIVRSR